MLYHHDDTHRRAARGGMRLCAAETAFELHLRQPTRDATAQWRTTLGAALYRELQSLAKTLGPAPPLHRNSETVLILPGFMGSMLAPPGKPALWFNPLAIASGQLPALRLPHSAHFVAASVLPFVYLRLRWRLRAAGYRVHYWPFDWRLHPAHNAARLLQDLATRAGAPVHLVAHSQGGLVAALALQQDPAGQWLGRACTLGTPFLGTPAAQAALAGEAPLLRRLAWLDPHHTAADLARRPLATWPGLQALLPANASGAAWNAAQPTPRLGCLAATGRHTALLNAAGEPETSLAGDGTVACASALAPTSCGAAGTTLPAGLGSHGNLPALKAVARQVLQFLQHGQFARCRARRAAPPADTLPAPNKASGWQQLDRDAQWRFLAEWAAPVEGPAPDLQPPPAPSWEVHRGVLWRRRAEIVMVGVFRHVAPAGLVRAMGMQAATARAIASGRFVPHLGAAERLYGRHAHPDVLLCGLDEFDRLDGARLTQATAAAVVHALRLGHRRIAMGLLGTTAGLTPATALAAQQAGIRLACAAHPVPYQLQIIWLSRRAPRAAWLRRKLGLPRVRKEPPAVLVMPPHILSPASNEPVPLPDYLLVRQEQEARRTVLRVALLPGRSKAALLAGSRPLDAKAQTKVLAPLGNGAGMAGVAAAGRALAGLLPPTIAEAIATPRLSPLVVVHDRAASLWPWETLEFGATPHRPALGQGMARHLEAPGLEGIRWKSARSFTSLVEILLIVNPTLDLSGADEEGKQLQALWAGDSRVRLTVLSGRDATRKRVLGALHDGRFDLVHYAGHAMFDELDPNRSGLLCARREVLQGADLATLEEPPHLLLANACESGRVRGQVPAPLHPGAGQPQQQQQQLHQQQRQQQRQRQAALAISLAEAFLRAGIAHYLGTWWPVADEPAAHFATRFHARLLQGATFGGAVLAARNAVHAQGSGDWADYLHYGDPTTALFRPYRRRVSNLNSARQPSRTEIPPRSKVQVSP